MSEDARDAGLRKAKLALLWWGIGCLVSLILAAALIAVAWYVHRHMTDTAGDMAPASFGL